MSISPQSPLWASVLVSYLKIFNIDVCATILLRNKFFNTNSGQGANVPPAFPK